MRLLTLLLMALSLSADAHRLELFAGAEGATISGHASLSGDTRAAGITIRVMAGDRLLALLTTEADGSFTYEARERVNHTLIAEDMSGHRAIREIAASLLPATLPTAEGAQAERAADHAHSDETAIHLDELEAAIARQLLPLREELHAMQTQTRWHDVLGGIGYIVGMLGLLAWLKSRPSAGHE